MNLAKMFLSVPVLKKLSGDVGISFSPTGNQASADPRSPCKGSGEAQRHESSFLSFMLFRKRQQDIHKRTSHTTQLSP